MTVIYRFPSRLQEQCMDVNNIQWHADRHSITVDGVKIALTATEYRLLFPLRHGTPVTYTDLAFQAYNYRFDDKVRVMMDKHIDRIRGKLRGSGVYIYCVLNYGYLLLPEVVEDDISEESVANN